VLPLPQIFFTCARDWPRLPSAHPKQGRCQKFSFRYVSGDDFWRAAKTGGRRTPVTFGRQPTQVFGRPCRSTKSVIALRRNFWLKRLTEEKECRVCYETRPPGWEYSLNWTLTVQTCCLEPVLNTRAQAVRHVQKRSEDHVKVIKWLVGAWTTEVYIAQSCLWKGRSLNCPETRWREVEDSQQSRRVTTCTTGKACLTKTSTERTTGVDDNPTGVRAGKFCCD